MIANSLLSDYNFIKERLKLHNKMSSERHEVAHISDVRLATQIGGGGMTETGFLVQWSCDCCRNR